MKKLFPPTPPTRWSVCNSHPAYKCFLKRPSSSSSCAYMEGLSSWRESALRILGARRVHWLYPIYPIWNALYVWDSLEHLLPVVCTCSQVAKTTSVGIWKSFLCLERWVLGHLFDAHQGLDGSVHTYTNKLH